MGIAELNEQTRQLTIYARLFFYGDAAYPQLCIDIARDIEAHWNDPQATVLVNGKIYTLRFSMQGIYAPALKPADVTENKDPENNYFRVEEYSANDISFVDGVNSNTGYFKLANLLNNSTTAAHEFGHTLGLDHPEELDIRGAGTPGIMYPRGTLVDPHFQYDPQVPAGEKGGTMNPFHRKVLQADVDQLQLHKIHFNKEGFAILGGFSSVWHERH
ncbi:MAG: peptidase M10 [Ferruginibacter sp.]